MVRFARRGATVVRLKGGDPSVFGRAAEERAFLEAASIAVEVIAGVTTASAAAAQFGFSLTQRDSARRVLFATGRTCCSVAGGWEAASDPETTLCLYMGCGDVATIACDLVAAGRDPDTPAIATVDVERPGARLIVSTLANLGEALAAEKTGGPVMIVMGPACASARAAGGGDLDFDEHARDNKPGDLNGGSHRPVGLLGRAIALCVGA
jgi:uroporphyrin-III C-methyltransferase